MKTKTSAKSKKTTDNCCSSSCSCDTNNNSCGFFLYGFGFLGAATYYIMMATSFWTGVLGVLKALVWPAFLVFELFRFLGSN